MWKCYIGLLACPETFFDVATWEWFAIVGVPRRIYRIGFSGWGRGLSTGRIVCWGMRRLDSCRGELPGCAADVGAWLSLCVLEDSDLHRLPGIFFGALSVIGWFGLGADVCLMHFFLVGIWRIKLIYLSLRQQTKTDETMKQYIVNFTEPVEYRYDGDVFNRETRRWETGEIVEKAQSFTFYSLKAAKAFISLHRDKYASSSIIKTWSNGDFENLGEIKLSGQNKTFVANTRQKVASY